MGRYSRQVEESIYFCVQEIVARSTMAGARQASISVSSTNDGLELKAAYGATAHPAAMTTVADRVDAAEGTLTLTAVGEETVIDVTLPARRLEPA